VTAVRPGPGGAGTAVDLDLRAQDQDGALLAPGTATVIVGA
jgi:hypothetical protein